MTFSLGNQHRVEQTYWARGTGAMRILSRFTARIYIPVLRRPRCFVLAGLQNCFRFVNMGCPEGAWSQLLVNKLANRGKRVTQGNELAERARLQFARLGNCLGHPRTPALPPAVSTCGAPQPTHSCLYLSFLSHPFQMNAKLVSRNLRPECAGRRSI